MVQKTTLYLPDDLHQQLRGVAGRQGRPQADIARQALAEYLAQQPQPPLSSLGAGDDSDLAAADTEDWLRDEWQRR